MGREDLGMCHFFFVSLRVAHITLVRMVRFGQFFLQSFPYDPRLCPLEAANVVRPAVQALWPEMSAKTAVFQIAEISKIWFLNFNFFGICLIENFCMYERQPTISSTRWVSIENIGGAIFVLRPENPSFGNAGRT